MFNIVKGVLVKYHTLLMRMTLDTSTIPNVRSNLFLFVDVKMLLGLNVVMFAFRCNAIFEKIYKITGCFVCDFRDIIKICEGDVYCMYCDSEYYFQDDLFISFLVTINFV
jgi:hypothetical protein